MASIPIMGTDATVSLPSGMGCGSFFNAFSYNLTQSTAEAVGFGQLDAITRGAVRRASGTVGGVLTKGTSNDAPAHTKFVSASAGCTLSFLTGCTFSFNAVFSGLNVGVAVEAFDQSAYSWVRDGATTETWVTT